MDPAPVSRFPVVPVMALVLTLSGWAAFLIVDWIGFISDRAEDMSVILWLAGWAMIVWALLLVVAQLVTLGLQVRAHRPVAPWDACTVGAATLLLCLVITSHPLWGEGSGSGG
jgi:hypothetical protein